MDKFLIIGIDPGITGAMAMIDQDLHLIGIADLPVMPTGVGNRQQINGAELAKILRSVQESRQRQITVRIEDVASMPQDGSVQAFSFGKNVGRILGILEALQIPYELIKPAEWKKRAGLWKKDKDASRTLAQQLYPEASLARKLDHNRAEAILIARFGG